MYNTVDGRDASVKTYNSKTGHNPQVVDNFLT